MEASSTDAVSSVGKILLEYGNRTNVLHRICILLAFCQIRYCQYNEITPHHGFSETVANLRPQRA